jgi:hypothetical protein
MLGFSGIIHIFYEKKTNDPIVLRSYKLNKYIPKRLGLLNVTKNEALFITTRYKLLYNEKIYIRSDLFDLFVSDLIYYTIGLSEVYIKSAL